MFDLEIFIVKLQYTDTIPPLRMEIRIVYTEGNVCKDTKNHELQKMFHLSTMERRNYFRIFHYGT